MRKISNSVCMFGALAFFAGLSTALTFDNAAASGQQTADGIEPPPPVTLENTELRVLYSEIVDQEFRLFIAKPFGPPPNADNKYPVIYLLDGDIAFPLVKQVALSLMLGGEMPPAIIVGVGYPGGMRAAAQLRTRDYTPTPDPRFTKWSAKWGGSKSEEIGSGGGPRFLRFIREELKPYIEANYPVDENNGTIFGASFGGLFAAYTLLEQPDTFQRYIMSSPSLWWDDRAIFALEEKYASAHDDMTSKVFIAVGGRETEEYDNKLPDAEREPLIELRQAMDIKPQMVEAVKSFVSTFKGRAYPRLDLTLHIFPDETHASVPPMSISRGLRVVFGTF